MSKTIITAAIAGVLSLVSAGALQAAERPSNHELKPLQGLTFDIGAKRAVSYFVHDNGACKLVLTIAETPDNSEIASFTATRFEAAIPGGQSTRYDSTEAEALEFACQADAQSLTVNTVERVAAAK